MQPVENIPCFNCDSALVQTGFFCGECFTQVRCKNPNCKSLLLQGAKGCIECGTPIEVKFTTAAPITQSGPQQNTIIFKQTGSKKYLKASFSDEVGGVLAGIAGNFVGVGSSQAKNPFAASRTQIPLRELGGKSVKASVSKSEVIEDAVIINPDEYSSILLMLIKENEGKLEITNSKLKDSGVIDKGIRMTLVLLYAYELIGKKSVERAVILEEISKHKLDNNHFKSWLRNGKELMVNNDQVELSFPGREKAEAVLREVADSTVEVGLIKFELPKAKSSKNKRQKSDERGSNGSAKSSKTSSGKSPADAINELIEEEYFTEKRTVGDLLTFLKEQKAQSFQPSPISTALARCISSKKLKREKNKSTNQYEYFVGV